MEKFYKKTVGIMTRNLRLTKKDMTKPVDDAIIGLKNASSIDDVMSAKKLLLVQLLGALPTGTGTCYFCIYHKHTGQMTPSCADCNYLKAHGRCGPGAKEPDTWGKMQRMIGDLQHFIGKNYWTGFELDAAKPTEEFDKKVVIKIRKNLNVRKQWITEIVNHAIYDSQNAHDIDDVMLLKERLLVGLLENLPLSGDFCYFCIYHKEICDCCSYRIVHGGRCGTAMGTTWREVMNRINKLKDFISNNYWTGNELEEGGES